MIRKKSKSETTMSLFLHIMTYISVFSLFTLNANNVTALETKDDLAELTKNLQSEWSFLMDKYDEGFQLTVKSQYDNSNPSTSDIQYHKGYERVLFYGENNTSEEIDVINPDYTFSVKRNSDKYYIQSLHKDMSHSQFFHSHLEGSMPAFAGFYAEDCNLLDLVQSHGFTILAKREYTSHDCEYCEIEFAADYMSDKFNKVKSGTLTFDTSHHWIVSKYTLSSEFNKSLYTDTKTVEYQFVDNIPFPKHTNVRYTHSNNKTVTLVQSFTVNLLRTHNREVFYLSYYGLPEPSHAMLDQKPNNDFSHMLFFLGACITLTSLALKFLSYYNRKISHGR